MPIIEVTLARGRSDEQLRLLIGRLSSAAQGALGVELSTVRILVREIPVSHWASGDITLEERYAVASKAQEEQ